MQHRQQLGHGYSPKTANEQGARLLANVSIKSEIDKEMAERSKRTGVNADRVIRELARIAFVNAGDIIDFDTGGVKQDVSDEDMSVIQSVKVKVSNGEKVDSEERETKLADKQKALEMLCKHLGIYEDKIKAEVEPSAKFADICKQLGGEGLSE